MKPALPVLLLLLSACGGGNRLLSSRADYALYRETRIARTTDARLAASDRYLRERPNGSFRAEVRSWYNRAEPRFYSLSRDRPSLLRAYLRVLPQGPHAAAAAARLEEFAILNQYRRAREAASERFITRVQSDLERAEAGRKAVLDELMTLARLLSVTRSFGRPRSELDPAILERVQLAPPAEPCAATSCQKDFRISYAVPAGKTLAPREASFSLSVALTSGMVTRLRVAGPELFSRLAEAVDRQPIAASDLQARAEAIGRSVQVIENAIEAALPAGECRRDVLAPVVLERECRGVRFRMAAALEVGGDDAFEIDAVAR